MTDDGAHSSFKKPFQQLKNTFNNTKRRLAERALQAAGMHGGSQDEEFEDSLRKYHELCDQLREVETVMQEYLASLSAFIDTQEKLAGKHFLFERSKLRTPIQELSIKHSVDKILNK